MFLFFLSFYVILDSLYNVHLHIGDILVVSCSSLAFIFVKDSTTFLPYPTLFHQIFVVVEGTWITEVDIYS